MTDKEFEALYKSSPEMTPPSELKADILLRMSSEMERKKTKKRSAFLSVMAKRWVPIAACFIFVFAFIGAALGLNNESYQTVYIDVNPSIALNVNRFGKVSSAEFLNEDACEALSGIKLKRLSVEDAFEKIIDAYEVAGYFEEDAEIYISAQEGKKADKLLEKLSKHAEKIKGNRGYSVNVEKLTAEDKALAKDYGISPGKYRVISEIIEKYPSYTVDDLKDKSMAELKELMPKDKNDNKKPK